MVNNKHFILGRRFRRNWRFKNLGKNSICPTSLISRGYWTNQLHQPRPIRAAIKAYLGRDHGWNIRNRPSSPNRPNSAPSRAVQRTPSPSGPQPSFHTTQVHYDKMHPNLLTISKQPLLKSSKTCLLSHKIFRFNKISNAPEVMDPPMWLKDIFLQKNGRPIAFGNPELNHRRDFNSYKLKYAAEADANRKTAFKQRDHRRKQDAKHGRKQPY